MRQRCHTFKGLVILFFKQSLFYHPGEKEASENHACFVILFPFDLTRVPSWSPWRLDQTHALALNLAICY